MYFVRGPRVVRARVANILDSNELEDLSMVPGWIPIRRVDAPGFLACGFQGAGALESTVLNQGAHHCMTNCPAWKLQAGIPKLTRGTASSPYQKVVSRSWVAQKSGGGKFAYVSAFAGTLQRNLPGTMI